MSRPFVVLLLPIVGAAFAVAAEAQKAPPNPFAASRKARDGRFGMLLRQFRADEPTLGERSEAGSRPATAVHQAARDVPAGFWVWQRPYWFVFRDGPDTLLPQRSWGTEAACGAPDTPSAGDASTAWATREQDAKDEWLLLEYAAPVRLTAVEVHETFNPGAISSLAILTPQGEELELWRNPEPKAAAEPGRILQIDVPLGFEVERIKLYFASDAVPGWNEIDAVGLRDDKGKVHWASRAAASSTYAEPAAGAAAAAPIVLGARQVVVLPQLQLEALPRVVLQAPLAVWQRAGAVQPADDDEKAKLRQRVAELEARVATLEAELARSKAGR